MPINEGKLNPGIEYQFLVIAYTAACLSENEDVEDYEIYTNHDEVPGFDDIIVKVKHKSQPQSVVYMGQIKRYKKIKIDLNEGDECLDTLLQYITKINDKTHRKPFLKNLLQNVPENNIEFWYFSNSFLKNPSKSKIFLRDGTQCFFSRDIKAKSIFPLQNLNPHFQSNTIQELTYSSNKPVACYKLSIDETHEYHKMLKRFYLFLNQPDHDKIPSCIVALNPDIFSIKTTNNLCNYIYTYLRKCQLAKLTKYVFETELSRLCLSIFSISPMQALKIHPQQANVWNELVLQYDVTVVDNTAIATKPYIFGCLWQKIMKLYNCAFNWNECITDFKKIDKIIDIKRFMELSKAKNFRHWLYAPDTIEDLLIEMWKSNYVPMVLSSDTKISILEKFQHLRKKFIVLDNKQKLYNEMSCLGLRVFATAADIREADLGKEFLKGIVVSLQGREPVNVFSIVKDDADLMKELTCEQLLHLIRERTISLKKEAFLEAKSVIFIIADESSDSNRIYIEETDNNGNVVRCKPSEVDVYIAKIENNPKTKNYSIYNLQVNDGRLELIKGDVLKLRKFIVDENGDDLYFQNDRVYPILGKRLVNGEKYISRRLQKPTVELSIFDVENKVICFLTGDLDTMNWNRNEIIQDSIDCIASRIEANLKRNTTAIVAIEDDAIEDVWLKFASMKRSLLHIKIENGIMLLLKYQNCPNLSSHISYNGSIFNEKFFFQETSLGITVITGEPGTGKSTLLHSLFSACDKLNYALFCDLNDYRQYLLERSPELLKNPIKFILRKESKPPKLPSSRYWINDCFLNFLNKFLERANELILFLDSFDEILPVCQEEVLRFIRRLNKPNVRLIIASRLVMTDTLINSLKVKPIKIQTLNTKDIKEYIDDGNLILEKLNEYPLEFRENPMYLSFMITLHQDESCLPRSITRYTLYNAIIEKSIQRYLNKKADICTPAQYEYLRKDVLDIHKSLALFEVFDDEIVKSLGLVYQKLMDECIYTDKFKLGIIVRFTDDRPVFLHRTFAEFLVAEWLSENFEQERVKDIYKMLFYESKIYIIRILNDIFCEDLPLHKAVLTENLTLVESLCFANDNYLKEVDKLNRTALLLASACCRTQRAEEKNYLILETIVRHMKFKGIDFNSYDSITKWTWIQYLKLNRNFLKKAGRFGLVVTLEMHFVCEEKIEEGIIWSICHGLLSTALALFKRKVCVLPKYFNQFVVAALILHRLSELCELIEWQNHCNTQFSILMKACKNLSPISTLRECKNLKIFGGFTATHIASMYGNTDVVKELLNLGATFDVCDNYKHKPLYYAIIQGNNEIVDCLLKHKSTLRNQKVKNSFVTKLLAKLTLTDTISELPKWVPSHWINLSDLHQLIYQPYLHVSLQNNYMDIAELLLKAGFHVDQKNNNGETALHSVIQNYPAKTMFAYGRFHREFNLRFAADQNNIEKIQLLLKYNTDCNIQDNSGNTPLHVAVRNNRLDVSEILLMRGVKTDLRNAKDETPVDGAIKSGNSKMLELLLKSGADSNFKDKCGNAPLHVAASYKGYHSSNNIITKVLLKAGANINQRNAKGNTILHIATENNDASLLEMALDYGADANIENGDGDNALFIAVKERNVKIIAMLLENGSKVNYQNKIGNTALHLAAQNKSINIVKILLENRGDVNTLNAEGQTPITIASTYENVEVMKLLEYSMDR